MLFEGRGGDKGKDKEEEEEEAEVKKVKEEDTPAAPSPPDEHAWPMLKYERSRPQTIRVIAHSKLTSQVCLLVSTDTSMLVSYRH